MTDRTKTERSYDTGTKQTPVLSGIVFMTCFALTITGCTNQPQIDVLLSNVVPVQSTLLEPRARLDISIRNFSQHPISAVGMTLELDVNGRRFARGVSNQKFSIPALGESTNSVVVGISMFDVIQQLLDMQGRQTFDYELRGKIVTDGMTRRNSRFKRTGEFTREQLSSLAGGRVRQ